ncbi:hypothetical protein C7974DRAFT_182615 [Boeremia exigua]|uniref:uncharacterized protein n=1 Tax=Boeremia exigua TaxID=749465 RepID=UPI001E8CBD8E|nr:uncharacterized protein C7974DRAFT_182615 [Boeremia exigua]KAH6629185.1 hypothetical protein C7974DRAFT_182615 [Boeremia exigua]
MVIFVVYTSHALNERHGTRWFPAPSRPHPADHDHCACARGRGFKGHVEQGTAIPRLQDAKQQRHPHYQTPTASKKPRITHPRVTTLTAETPRPTHPPLTATPHARFPRSILTPDPRTQTHTSLTATHARSISPSRQRPCACPPMIRRGVRMLQPQRCWSDAGTAHRRDPCGGVDGGHSAWALGLRDGTVASIQDMRWWLGWVRRSVLDTAGAGHGRFRGVGLDAQLLLGLLGGLLRWWAVWEDIGIEIGWHVYEMNARVQVQSRGVP